MSKPFPLKEVNWVVIECAPDAIECFYDDENRLTATVTFTIKPSNIDRAVTISSISATLMSRNEIFCNVARKSRVGDEKKSSFSDSIMEQVFADVSQVVPLPDEKESLTLDNTGTEFAFTVTIKTDPLSDNCVGRLYLPPESQLGQPSSELFKHYKRLNSTAKLAIKIKVMYGRKSKLRNAYQEIEVTVPVLPRLSSVALDKIKNEGRQARARSDVYRLYTNLEDHVGIPFIFDVRSYLKLVPGTKRTFQVLLLAAENLRNITPSLRGVKWSLQFTGIVKPHSEKCAWLQSKLIKYFESITSEIDLSPMIRVGGLGPYPFMLDVSSYFEDELPEFVPSFTTDFLTNEYTDFKISICPQSTHNNTAFLISQSRSLLLFDSSSICLTLPSIDRERARMEDRPDYADTHSSPEFPPSYEDVFGACSSASVL